MNKQSFITILLTVFLSMVGEKTFAYDIAKANDDGITIYYRIFNDKAIITYEYDDGGDYYSHYSGKIVIPKSVEYGGKTYNVTGIDNHAFNYCPNLTSVGKGGAGTSAPFNFADK